MNSYDVTLKGIKYSIVQDDELIILANEVPIAGLAYELIKHILSKVNIFRISSTISKDSSVLINILHRHYTFRNIFDKTRSYDVREARQVYFFIMNQILGYGPSELERYSKQNKDASKSRNGARGFDHATVLHSVKAVLNDMETDEKTRIRVTEIINSFMQ